MKRWKKTLNFVFISIFIFISISLYVSADGAAPKSTTYVLSNSINAEVKSVLNEQSADATRIGVVVRLHNSSLNQVKVPEYELKMMMTDDSNYTLTPSEANVKIIQAKETVELSYMAVLNLEQAPSLSSLSWVNVDRTIYPKKEHEVLTIPIAAMDWSIDEESPERLKAWGETFLIPEDSKNLHYSPVHVIPQMTEEGHSLLVVMKVENMGSASEWIPTFELIGKSTSSTYSGERLNEGEILLPPDIEKYLYYTISINQSDELNRLILRTPDHFVQSDAVFHYSVAQLQIQLPEYLSHQQSVNLPESQLGHPLSFDPLNQLVPDDVDISLVGMELYKGEGYNAIVADFKIQNRNSHAISLPSFEAELINMDGTVYAGTRQETTLQSLVPNIKYALSYTFILPSSEESNQMTLQILDENTLPPYKVPIASLSTVISMDDNQSSFSFYPHNVVLNDWSLDKRWNASLDSDYNWNYTLTLDLTMNQEEGMVSGQHHTNMRVELTSRTGKPLGTKMLRISGDERIGSGEHVIRMDSNFIDDKPIISIYKTITTLYGEAEILLKNVQ